MTFLTEISELTLIHVGLSLIALGSGIAAVISMLVRQRHDSLTALFLITTAATSISAFLFPWTGITFSLCVAVASMVLLLFPLLGLYVFAMRGWWYPLGVGGAVAAFYLNAMMASVQAFYRIPTLRVLAPTHIAPLFLITQAVLLLAFVAIGYAAVHRCNGDCMISDETSLDLGNDGSVIG